jgi:hypothetical protein
MVDRRLGGRLGLGLGGLSRLQRGDSDSETDKPCTHAPLALLGELSMPCNRTCACNRTRRALLGDLGLARCPSRGAPALLYSTALCYAPPWRYAILE